MIIEELTEGLPGFTDETAVEINEDTSEFKAINPPTTRDNQKTIKKRKIQRRLRNEERQRQNVKIEKKKISDLYRYNYFVYTSVPNKWIIDFITIIILYYFITHIYCCLLDCVILEKS